MDRSLKNGACPLKLVAMRVYSIARFRSNRHLLK